MGGGAKSDNQDAFKLSVLAPEGTESRSLLIIICPVSFN